MWQRQEAEWQRDRERRDQLMQQVLDERRAQIDRDLAKTRAQQAESIRSREIMLERLDVERHESAAESVRMREEERQYGQELHVCFVFCLRE